MCCLWAQGPQSGGIPRWPQGSMACEKLGLWLQGFVLLFHGSGLHAGLAGLVLGLQLSRGTWVASGEGCGLGQGSGPAGLACHLPVGPACLWSAHRGHVKVSEASVEPAGCTVRGPGEASGTPAP